MKFAEYWKAIIAALAPIFLLVQSAVTDGEITTAEWVGIAAAAAIAVGVFFKRNAPPAPAPPPPPPSTMPV